MLFRVFRALLFAGAFRFAIHELDVGHRRIVAGAEASLQDAEITARTLLVMRTELVEQLGDDLAITQAIKCQPALRDGVFLRERDQRLDDAANFLRLRQRGLDGFVTKYGGSKVTQHGAAVTAVAAQLPADITVTHGSL